VKNMDEFSYAAKRIARKWNLIVVDSKAECWWCCKFAVLKDDDAQATKKWPVELGRIRETG